MCSPATGNFSPLLALRERVTEAAGHVGWTVPQHTVRVSQNYASRPSSLQIEKLGDLQLFSVRSANPIFTLLSKFVKL